jgi:hypothetical protein
VSRIDRGWSYPPVELRREDIERLWPVPSSTPDRGAEDRSALLREQDAALKKLAAGEGDPLELAAVLRQLPELLDVCPQLSDTEHVRLVRGLCRLSDPSAVALVESGQVPVHIAAEIGHRAYHIFAHLYPPEVGQAFQAEIWPVY